MKKTNLYLIPLSIFFCIFAYFEYKGQKEKNIEDLIRKTSFDTSEDLMMYVNKFYRDTEHFGIKTVRPSVIIVKMSNLDRSFFTSDYHGVSLGMNDDSKIEIYLNHTSWTNMTRAQKYFIMYHELGHDVLNRGHNSRSDNPENSIMKPMMSIFDKVTMDDFIESSHLMFDGKN